MQRLRGRFSRGEEVKYISHLDIIRLWERAFRRADIPLVYSEGFNPHPRISLAAPLSVGVTGESELMDVFVTDTISPHWFIAAVNRQLPPGIKILEVRPVGVNLPSLQSQIRFAEYRVEVETEKDLKYIQEAITGLLSTQYLPWHHHRDTGRRNYNLRALIESLWLIDNKHLSYTIGMRLRCDSTGSGRPEQVIMALGITQHPQSLHRTRLVLGAGK